MTKKTDDLTQGINDLTHGIDGDMMPKDFQIACSYDEQYDRPTTEHFYKLINTEREGWLKANKQKIFPLLKFLTVKQQIIVQLLLENKTQKQIAKTLGMTQGGVSLAINGTPKLMGSVRSGGIIKRLKKAVKLAEDLKKSSNASTKNTSRS